MLIQLMNNFGSMFMRLTVNVVQWIRDKNIVWKRNLSVSEAEIHDALECESW